MEKSIEILAMDDDPLIVRFLEKVFHKWGLAFYSAGTARAGIEILESKKETLSCVLLDLSLPDQNWSQTVDALLAIQPELKIIISSGSLVEDQTHERDPRIYDHLPKPFSMVDLQKLIQKI